MTKIEADKLAHGLYIIHWKDTTSGRPSLASVGMTYDGTRWYAPCNWTSSDNARPMVASTDWDIVARVVLVAGYDVLDQFAV